MSANEEFLIEQEISSEEKLNAADPYSKLLWACFNDAYNLGASDIHFEPDLSGINIRMRIYGVLKKWKKLGPQHSEPVIQRIKTICELDLSIIRNPQDGRISLPTLNFDARVNTLPTIYGEKIVFRLLSYEQKFNLDMSGIKSNCLKLLKEALNSQNGLIILSGPTGSGKTTTLYSLLHALDFDQLNVTTIENPVEYRIPGITQVDVREKNLSFSDALRALMRQDPDVILVGEIRDEETAKLCINAASTGHFVFSTVHANGALEVVDRLKSLGVDPFLIKKNIRLSAAQRLVKQLCPYCSISIDETSQRKINPNGCERCSQGIVGRLPILEVATNDCIKSYLHDSSAGPKISFKSELLNLIQTGLIDSNQTKLV